MPNVSSDFLAGLLTQYRALFEREFHAAMNAAWWPRYSMRFETPGHQFGNYSWMGTVPKMEDVTHKSAAISGLNPSNFNLENREFQAAIEIERMAIERDQLGVFPPRIAQLGLEAARYPAEQIFALVRDNAVGFDGAAYFANTRTIGESANIDNLLGGTGTTIAQIQADIAQAQGVMSKFQDDRGRPMNLGINMFMIAPEIEQLFWQALNRTTGDSVNPPVQPSGTFGMWQASGYTVIRNPYLADANDWYGFYIGGPAESPFLYQVEKMPVVESDTNADSRENIINRKFLYSVYGRWNVALTDPRFGVKMVNT